jgi:transaldolase
VSAEVTSEEAEGMVAEAERIARWSPHVVVKVPVTEEGLKAIHALSQWEPKLETICEECAWEGECDTDQEMAWRMVASHGLRTNATLVFSPNQTLLAALAGATFISPFIGRLDEIGHDGMEILEDIIQIIDYYDLESLVIAASIRHPLHVTQAALAGAHIATVPYDVLMKMIKHPLTDVGVERFLADWKKVKG